MVFLLRIEIISTREERRVLIDPSGQCFLQLTCHESLYMSIETFSLSSMSFGDSTWDSLPGT